MPKNNWYQCQNQIIIPFSHLLYLSTSFSLYSISLSVFLSKHLSFNLYLSFKFSLSLFLTLFFSSQLDHMPITLSFTFYITPYFALFLFPPLIYIFIANSQSVFAMIWIIICCIAFISHCTASSYHIIYKVACKVITEIHSKKSNNIFKLVKIFKNKYFQEMKVILIDNRNFNYFWEIWLITLECILYIL